MFNNESLCNTVSDKINEKRNFESLAQIIMFNPFIETQCLGP